MAKKLNRSKEFGMICGGSGDARFEQDGQFFDSCDNLIGVDSVATPDKPTKAGGKGVSNTPEPELSDLDQQLLQQGV